MKILALFSLIFVFFTVTKAQELPALPQPPSQQEGDTVPHLDKLELDAPKALPADPHLKKRITWTPEGSRVVFGAPNGELLWRGYNKHDIGACAQLVNPVCQECWNKKLHPWLWQEQVDLKMDDTLNAELIWFVTGSYEDLEAELEREGGDYAGFIWLGLDPNAKKRVVISLEPDGIGMMRVYQGEEQLIAQARCVSGDRTQEVPKGKLRPQPNPGAYTMRQKATKARTDDPAVKAVWSKAASCWMDWALCLDSDRGIFVHAGDLGGRSKGCIRISYATAVSLFSRVPYNSTFKVEWVSEGDSQKKPSKNDIKDDKISI